MRLGPLQGLMRGAFTTAMPLIPGFAFGRVSRAAINLGLLQTHQPLYAGRQDWIVSRDAAGARTRQSCYERSRAIFQELDGAGGTCLDLGSNVGFFSLALADRGFRTVGVDPELKHVRLAQGMSRFLKLPNATFMHDKVTPSNIAALGEYDVVLCLSVLDYWVVQFGAEPAVELVLELGRRCRSRFFFETGGPTAPGYETILSFMNPDPQQWAFDMLASAGFQQVRCLGPYPVVAEAAGSPRHLFVGVKDG